MKSSLFSLLLAPGLLVSTPALAALGGPVTLADGQVVGTSVDDPSVTTFWGLPYAAPPVGPLRFRPPEPARPWQGVRDATHPAAICPQVPKGNIAGMKIDEDCLNLDVWTGAAKASERRPVMVWFHGGTRGAGASSDPVFNGTALAKKGVIVVVVNYRGGPLGLLATPELSKENAQHVSGNYGLLDDIAALKWVQRNIASFGGDPANVTIFGESFGAGTVNFLGLTPLSRGLFRRMITQSHALYSHDPVLLDNATRYQSLPEAEESGQQYMKIAGATSAAELRAMPWQKLYEAFAKSFKTVGWTYAVDGYVLPQNYTDTYAAGAQADVEALTGENRDENGAAADTAFDLVAAGHPVPANTIALLPYPDYLAYVHKKYGAMADDYLKLYPASNPREAFASANQAIRDNAQISPWMWAHAFTQKHGKPAYIYMFSKAPPGPEQGVTGAYHGADVRYVFDNPLPNWGADDRRVADMMSTYWVNFATSGNPNGPGLPQWQAFDPKVEQTMELGGHFRSIAFPDREKLAFWQRFYASQPGR